MGQYRGEMMKKEYYYQIKGKDGKNTYGIYGSSNWGFPPIFSGKVTANDRKEAKEIIENEYGKKFPLRVLSKDLENNEFLLRITEMQDNPYLRSIFNERECIECKQKYRRIDLYNDINEKYKGTEYCSESCKEKAYEKRRFETSESMFDNDDGSNNVPVIYKITNRTTNMCYVGQTTQSFTLRWWQHIKWGKSDCKFHDAIKKSKLTDWIFEVIEVLNSKEKLDEREAYYIKEFESIKKGYNTMKVNHETGRQNTLCRDAPI